MSNYVISISREFGSGGHVIAEMLAEKFGLPLYDSNILEEIALNKNLDHKAFQRYDEAPRNKFFTRTVRGHHSSPEEHIAQLQFNYLREKAEKGESFVVVGRCSETILRGYPGLVSIFVLADKEAKIERIKNLNKISSIEAEVMINKQDRQRKFYHNYHCSIKWGDSRNYDISINSSKMGIERTADTLEAYIKERMAD